MHELRCIRASVNATQQHMADEMGLSLRAYRSLEGGLRLDDDLLGQATFAALRMAVETDGNPGWWNAELLETFEKILRLFGLASHQHGTLH